MPTQEQDDALYERFRTQLVDRRVREKQLTAELERLKRAIASHHPGQPTCDTCQSVLRSMGEGKDRRL